jgi:hypothetical protein
MTSTDGAEQQRAVPYHCPFCAEEDLRPLERGAALAEGARLERGGWHCRSCCRVFSLTFHGLLQPAAAPQRTPGSVSR